MIFFCEMLVAYKKNGCIFASSKESRGLSSAGSEHLPYKQRVTGSNPVAPTTKKSLAKAGLFFFLVIHSHFLLNVNY
jgi:hypothetical protein